MQNPPKKIIGLLGGIGSGKSAVAKEFARLGCAVISADQLAHKHLDDEDVIRKVADLLGDGVFADQNTLNKKKIAEIVFSDAKKLAKLNNIIHPLVMNDIQQFIDEKKDDNSAKAIVLDIPLLMEVGWERNCNILIFINCHIEKRLERAAKKGEFFKNHLQLREKFQISLDKKSKIAHHTINNNSSLSAMRKQVEEIFYNITMVG